MITMFMHMCTARCRYGKYYFAIPKFYTCNSFCAVRKALGQECLGAKLSNRSLGCILPRSFSSYLMRGKKPLRIFRKYEVGIAKSLNRRLATGGKKPNKEMDGLKSIPNLYLILLITSIIQYYGFKPRTVQWDEFVQEMLSKGEVEKIVFHENISKATVYLKPGAMVDKKFDQDTCLLVVPDVKTFEEDLRDVEEKLGIAPGDGVLVIHRYRFDFSVLFLCALLLFFMYVMAKTFSMNKINPFDVISKAKYTLIDPLAGHTKGVKFSDVGGLHEAKQEIMEFVDYLKRPEHYKDLGAKVPKGALLLGPPGCGKTLLAKAVASEANVPFLSMNGSEFIELVGGLGAARVRDLFSDARNISPCIIYIDEIDAIGKKRSGSGGFQQSHSEAEHTLNQLLVEMDGMASREGVVTLASTNRAEVLDSALLRPGRFDRHIMIDLPNVEERREIFVQHLNGIHLEHKPEYYSKRMASLTPGFSGADIANVCNEAALHAARFRKEIVTGEDLEYAVERVVGGTEKRSSAISPEEKHLVAYHEAGRALIGWLTEHGEILVKMSVVPRTHQSVGWAQFSLAENYLLSEDELFDKMCMALGGRVAESLVFNKVSTKSEKDLRKVTRIAYAQVRQYGMNKMVGPLSFGDTEEHSKKPYSKQLSALIDREARALVYKAFLKAEKILRENKDKLVKVAEELLRRETINYSDVVALIGPPVNATKKTVEPLVFDMTIDMVAGPEPSSEEGKREDS